MRSSIRKVTKETLQSPLLQRGGVLSTTTNDYHSSSSNDKHASFHLGMELFEQDATAVERALQEKLDSLERDLRAVLADAGNSSNNKGLVTIVTGTGAHSPSGPVLRSAVLKLLQRRQMQFALQAPPGSILVNALSGVPWYKQQCQAMDTKVIVVTQPTPALRMQLRRGGNHRARGYLGAAARW